MKHVLLNSDGQTHAVILACPFKYTLPRGFSVQEDNPSMGLLPVDTFCHTQPKCKDDVDMHAMDFAVIRNGIIENVVQWGGAEWCPPAGITLVPLESWMGIGDKFDEVNQSFAIHEDRLGTADKNKSVAELEADGL
jgi:hypothetical protein